jgi:hypothetical protein
MNQESRCGAVVPVGPIRVDDLLPLDAGPVGRQRQNAEDAYFMTKDDLVKTQFQGYAYVKCNNDTSKTATHCRHAKPKPMFESFHQPRLRQP